MDGFCLGPDFDDLRFITWDNVFRGAYLKHQVDAVCSSRMEQSGFDRSCVGQTSFVSMVLIDYTAHVFSLTSKIFSLASATLNACLLDDFCGV